MLLVPANVTPWEAGLPPNYACRANGGQPFGRRVGRRVYKVCIAYLPLPQVVGLGQVRALSPKGHFQKGHKGGWQQLCMCPVRISGGSGSVLVNQTEPGAMSMEGKAGVRTTTPTMSWRAEVCLNVDTNTEDIITTMQRTTTETLLHL